MMIDVILTGLSSPMLALTNIKHVHLMMSTTYGNYEFHSHDYNIHSFYIFLVLNNIEALKLSFILSQLMAKILSEKGKNP